MTDVWDCRALEDVKRHEDLILKEWGYIRRSRKPAVRAIRRAIHPAPSPTGLTSWLESVPADGEWYCFDSPTTSKSAGQAKSRGLEAALRRLDQELGAPPIGRYWLYVRRTGGQSS